MQVELRNQLLKAMPQPSFAQICGYLEPISFSKPSILSDIRAPIEHVYFPETGVVSIFSRANDSDGVQVGLIGREGMSGAGILLGAETSSHRHLTIVGGHGHRLKSQQLVLTLQEHPDTQRFLLRYAHTLMLQISVTALVNATFLISERLARWLLMLHDRSETNEVLVTHQWLASMLGVRRPGITEALNSFESNLLIKASPGRIRILDREGLLRLAGAGYGVPENVYQRFFGVEANAS